MRMVRGLAVRQPPPLPYTGAPPNSVPNLDVVRVISHFTSDVRPPGVYCGANYDNGVDVERVFEDPADESAYQAAGGRERASGMCRRL
jgi:hypothetical protein